MVLSRRLSALAFGTLLVAVPVLLAPVESAAVADPTTLLSSAAYLAARGDAPRAGDAWVAPLDADAQVTTDGAAQNEPAVGVNPTNPSNVIAAWNDYSAANGATQVWMGVGTSHDGGKTWNSRLIEPNPKSHPQLRSVLEGQGAGFTHGGDPLVAFNGKGVGLVGQIMFDSGLRKSQLAVQATLDGGDSFLPPVFAAWSGRGGTPAGFTDKPWMRGDLRGDAFYICWTHFSSGFGTSDIFVTASTDGLGAVWSPPVKVSTENGVQGCDIAISPNGDVAVVYLDFDWSLTSGGVMKVVRSTNQGLTWTAPATIAPVAPLAMPNSAFRYQHFPRVAVDGATSALYLVWAEGAGDIVLTKSTDGGVTWTPKRLVNNDGRGATQHMPAIDVAPDGKVVVGFYDRRDDPANRFMLYYLAESVDGGATFPTQYAAGTLATDGLNTRHWFMGDYTDLRIGSDGVPHATWTAAPGTNQDIYTNA